MYAGAAGDALIAAGGANFPDVPAAEGGEKTFYDGVFLLRGGVWNRAGRLPAPAAYGVTFPVGDGLVLAGGANASGALRSRRAGGGSGRRRKTLPGGRHRRRDPLGGAVHARHACRKAAVAVIGSGSRGLRPARYGGFGGPSLPLGRIRSAGRVGFGQWLLLRSRRRRMA